MLLVKNTPWARKFFRQAEQALWLPSAMAAFLAEDVRLHGERNATLEQVIMYLLLSDEAGNQPKVRRHPVYAASQICGRQCNIRTNKFSMLRRHLPQQPDNRTSDI